MAHVPHEERRRQLVAATIQVMQTSGMDAVTSRRVAEVAGAPLASIHYTFGSVDAMVIEAYGQVLDEVLAEVTEGLPLEQGFAVALPALARRVAEVLAGERYRVLVVDLNPVRDQRLAPIEQRYYDIGPAIVRRIAEASGEQPTLDPDTLGRLLLACVDGVLLQFGTHGDPARFRDDLVELARILAWRATHEAAAPESAP